MPQMSLPARGDHGHQLVAGELDCAVPSWRLKSRPLRVRLLGLPLQRLKEVGHGRHDLHAIGARPVLPVGESEVGVTVGVDVEVLEIGDRSRAGDPERNSYIRLLSLRRAMAPSSSGTYGWSRSPHPRVRGFAHPL